MALGLLRGPGLWDAPPNLTQPLLGMNVLQKFRIEQDGGEMRFSPRNRR